MTGPALQKYVDGEFAALSATAVTLLGVRQVPMVVVSEGGNE